MASRSWIVLSVLLAAGGDAAAATRPQGSGADTRVAAESRSNVGRPARERFTLPNGLEVLIESVPAMPQVGLAITFDVGAIDLDPDPPFDTSAFIALSWLVTGDAPGSPRLHSDLRRRYGATWCAETGRDYTLVAFAVPRPRFDDELAAIAGRLAQTSLDRPTLRKVTGADGDQFDSMFMVFLAYASFDGVPPFAWSVHGRITGLWGRWPPRQQTAESAPARSPEEFRSLMRRRLRDGILAIRPDIGHLAIVGPVDAGGVASQVRRAFGAIPLRSGLDARRGRSAVGPRAVAMAISGVPSVAVGPAQMIVGVRAPAARDPMLPATLLFNGKACLCPRVIDRFIAARFDLMNPDSRPETPIDPDDFPGHPGPSWGIVPGDEVVGDLGQFLRGSICDPGAILAQAQLLQPDDAAASATKILAATAKELGAVPAAEETEQLRSDLRRRLGYERPGIPLDEWDPMHRAITYARQIELGVDPDAFRLAVDAVVPADRPRMVRALLGEPPYVVEVLK